MSKKPPALRVNHNNSCREPCFDLQFSWQRPKQGSFSLCVRNISIDLRSASAASRLPLYDTHLYQRWPRGTLFHCRLVLGRSSFRTALDPGGQARIMTNCREPQQTAERSLPIGGLFVPVRQNFRPSLTHDVFTPCQKVGYDSDRRRIQKCWLALWMGGALRTKMSGDKASTLAGYQAFDNSLSSSARTARAFVVAPEMTLSSWPTWMWWGNP